METAPTQDQGNDEFSTLTEVIESLLTELHTTDSAPPPVRLDSSLDRDLGLDSLSRLELFARIEQRLPDLLFAEAETPRDILRALASSRAQLTLSHRPSSRHNKPLA